MKATLRRSHGRPRLELDAETAEERKLLQRWCEMLNDNVRPLRTTESMFDTPLRLEGVDIHAEDTLIDMVAIETGFEREFRKAPKK